MSTLIIVEHDNKVLHPNTKNVLAAAIEFGEEITLLVAGLNCEEVAKEAALLKGVSSVWLADNACYANLLAEAIAELVISKANSFKTILAPASTFGKNILPRIAACLDVAQLSDLSKIIDKETFEHPIYAGNAIETVKLLDSIKVLTVRPTAFSAVDEEQAPCSIERLDKVANSQTKFIKQELTQSSRPELGSARVIVSGGRGLQNAEKFKLVEELADCLNAAVGASRAAVDAGFVSNDYQVGQTGKIVAPSLYIAIGISGAVQHLAGMKDSKVIVAINKDEDAPIFQIADYGLVGDLFEIVPEMIKHLK